MIPKEPNDPQGVREKTQRLGMKQKTPRAKARVSLDEPNDLQGTREGTQRLRMKP